MELERISMFPRERLIDYVHRVSRLYRQVTVRAKELIGENIERTMKDVERLARSSFIIALPQGISTKVALLNPESLGDAFDLALHMQRREQELASLPRDDTYEYVRSPRAPSLIDPQRKWSEWRQPIETSPYDEPLPSYSAYSYPRYRDDYYRDSYSREPYYHDDYRRELDRRELNADRRSRSVDPHGVDTEIIDSHDIAIPDCMTHAKLESVNSASTNRASQELTSLASPENTSRTSREGPLNVKRHPKTAII